MRSGFYAEYTRLAPVLGTCIRLWQFNFRRAARFEAWLVRRSLLPLQCALVYASWYRCTND